MKYTRSFFSYICKNLGINVLLVFIMCTVLFSFIFIGGYKESVENEDSSDSLKGYEYNLIEPFHFSYDQVEDLYDAISNSVQSVDHFVVRSENTLEIFDYSDNKLSSFVSIYPFDAFFFDKQADFSNENEHSWMIPYDQFGWLIYSFSSDSESGNILITQPSPNEVTFSVSSKEDSFVSFQTVATSSGQISPHISSLFLIASWEQMKSVASPISGISFVVQEKLSEGELAEVNRLSKYILGNEFELYSESSENSNLLPNILISIGVGFAVFFLLQIFLYICDLRRQEFLVYAFCGETSWGILFHCLYHFIVLLLATNIIAIVLSLLFNYIAQSYSIMITLRHSSIATIILVFDFFALITCCIRVFICQVCRKEICL